jgi:hypothetical protein
VLERLTGTAPAAAPPAEPAVPASEQ